MCDRACSSSMLISLSDPHKIRFQFRTHSLPSSYMVCVCLSEQGSTTRSPIYDRQNHAGCTRHTRDAGLTELTGHAGHLPWLVIQIFTVRKGGWSFDPLPDCQKTAACLPYPEPLQTQEIERFSSCGILRQNKTLLFTTTTWTHSNPKRKAGLQLHIQSEKTEKTKNRYMQSWKEVWYLSILPSEEKV